MNTLIYIILMVICVKSAVDVNVKMANGKKNSLYFLFYYLHHKYSYVVS